MVPPDRQATYERFHYAPAVRVGDQLYVSGVIGLGSDGRVAGEATEEFRDAFHQLGTILEAAGATMGDIVDITSFHVDLPTTLQDFMAVKDEFVAEPYPAWTAIGCVALAVPGARAEVKVVAVIDSAATPS